MFRKLFAIAVFALLSMPAFGANGSGQNSDLTLLTLTAAGASTVNSPDQINATGRCAQVGINLTTMTTAAIVVTVQGKDASGTYYTLLASASISSTGFTLMTICPGSPTTTNVSAALPLPRTWRVSATITGASAAANGKISASVIQ